MRNILFQALSAAACCSTGLLGACGSSEIDDQTDPVGEAGEGGASGGGGSSGSSSGGGGTTGGGCSYAGKTYAPGQSFPSDDGCNTCSCGADGLVACTLRACVAPHADAGSGFASCQELEQAIADELALLEACSADSECGQVLTGTSCGCSTRDPVARLDADPTRLNALLGTTVRGQSCGGLGSACDCPQANGYVCREGRCAWNYCGASPVDPGMLCVRGTTGSSGETLVGGDSLRVQVTPAGCWSSSCTRVDWATCLVVGNAYGVPESSPFTAQASFCLSSTAEPGQGCTADCGGGGFAECITGAAPLALGQHTVTLGALSVTFTVPSTLPFGGACDGSPF